MSRLGHGAGHTTEARVVAVATDDDARIDLLMRLIDPYDTRLFSANKVMGRST